MDQSLGQILKDYKFQSKVYVVLSQQGDIVVLAINPKFRDNYLVWFDSIKERMRSVGKIIKADSAEFSFISDDNNVIYTFLPLTVELYEKNIKRHLIAPGVYKDLADLENKILSTIKS
ncbi:MAG: hypothetical protein HY225_03645, partial [Candidatus Vogelbacteria bacterium]|nr:hypothetical protein [Candidatus Vogelbacteria bacterium]